MRAWTAIAVLMLGGLARADWVNSSVVGTPADISPVDGGFLVSTTSGVYRLTCNAAGCVAPAMVLGGSFGSAFEVSSGCVGMVSPSGNNTLSWVPAGCGKTTSITGATSSLSFRTRTTPSGLAYGTLRPSLQNFSVYTNPDVTSVASTWSQINLGTASYTGSGGSIPALSVSAFDGGEYVLTTPSLNSAYRGLLLNDGGIVASQPVGTPLTIIDAQLFNTGPELGALFVVQAGTITVMRMMPDVFDGGFVTLSPIGTTTARLVPQGGSALSAGFSIAALNDGGLLGATPNPSQLGLDWHVRSSVPGAVLTQVECQSPGVCVGIASAATSNLWVYTNTGVPLVDQTAIPINDVAGNAVAVDAGDSDGDPVFISWPTSAGGLTFTPTSVDGRQVTVDSARSMTCANSLQTVMVTVSDGWAPHEQVLPVKFSISASPQPPAAPPPAVAVPSSTQAGGAAVALTATPAAPSCATTGLTWALDGGAGGQLVPGAFGTATYTPPLNLCQANGVDEVIVVTATGPGGTSPASSTVVHVAPWGPPLTPTFADAGIQIAGTTAMYSPDPDGEHVCNGSSMFPPVTYNWPPGSVASGGIISVTVPDCVAKSIDIDVTRTVAGQTSDAGTLHVRSEVVLQQPISDFDAGLVYGAGVASGVFSVAGVNCIDLRGLTADGVVIAMDLTDAGSVSRRAVPLAGAQWTVPVTGGCNGGRFSFDATLYDDAGSLVTTQQTFFDTGRLDAGVGELVAGPFEVTCGLGLKAQVSVTPVPNTCVGAPLTWVQRDGGPELTQQPGPDPLSISVQSVSTELEDLVGQSVSWDVTATAGPDNAATRTTSSVTLTAAPFVNVVHRANPPSGSNDGLVAMELTLTSASNCDVLSLQLDETLNGLVFSEGTAELDGQRVQATSSGGVLRVPNIALAAHSTHRLTYAARTPAFRRQLPTAVVSLRGVPVSINLTPAPAPVACGCASTGPVLVALAGLMLRRSRRRRS